MKVIKIEPESVLIKSGQVEAWMDVEVDPKEGEVFCGWNQYIFQIDDANDMRQKAWQEDAANFADASNLAIATLEKAGYIYADEYGVWHSRVDTLFGSSPLVSLQQDAHDKIKVVITRNHLPMLLREHFGWRKNVTLMRLYQQGTEDFDAFIKFAKSKGYWG